MGAPALSTAACAEPRSVTSSSIGSPEISPAIFVAPSRFRSADGHLGALRSKAARDRRADAAGAAGDEGLLPFQPHGAPQPIRGAL